MNQLKRIQRAVDWKAMGWTPYQPDNLPFEGQTVEVCLSNKRVLVAVYDPKWEHGFHVNNEAVPNRPTMWRPIPAYRAKADKTYVRPVEFVV